MCTKMPNRPRKGQSGNVSRQSWCVKQASWGCSQIGNEEAEKEEDWQKEDQTEVQWAEDEKLEESLKRRRMCENCGKGTGASGA